MDVPFFSESNTRVVMHQSSARGLSACELFFAVILLATVSITAVVFIAPRYDQSLRHRDRQRVAQLNRIVQKFYSEQGRWPDVRLHDLIRARYLSPDEAHFPYLRTPLGSIYLFDRLTNRVYNPIVQREQIKPYSRM